MYYQAVTPRKRIRPMLEEVAFVQLQRTADAQMHAIAALLKKHGLSVTQYNVLRILRGAGPPGLPCREVANRMITRDPDVTRLLDRLEAAELVRRERQRTDRRVILVEITAKGLDLVDSLDRPVRDVHRKRLGHMNREALRTLIDLLEEVRRSSDVPME